jgi:uncharacterized protein (TIGR03118 family)
MSATLFDQTNLVSDQAGVAQIQDKHLINPWGATFNPDTGAFWVSDNDAGVATLYSGDVNGGSLSKAPLVVKIPGGEPTGVVNNTSKVFVVGANGSSAPALFIFASEDGNISGWNPNVPPPAPSTNAQPAAHVDGAFFSGLAIGKSGGDTFLYAADFANGKIDVFNGAFHQRTLSGRFHDPHVPAGLHPYNIQNLDGHLYVTYAPQPGTSPNVKGAVDEFDTSGHFMRRIATGGGLNTPWGLALAPKTFGSFGGDLLVGNLADGHINAFDPSRNFASEGQLKNADGKTIAIDRLWSLNFGNGKSAGDSNALYFTAGPDHYQHGLFGSIRVARSITATPFADGKLSGLQVKSTGDADTLSITANTTAGTTTVITDGRTQVFDHLFSEIDVQMSGKHSHMTFDLPGTTKVDINNA